MFSIRIGVILVYIGKMFVFFLFYFCNFCIFIFYNLCFLVVRRLYNFYDFVIIIGGKVEDVNLFMIMILSFKVKLIIKEIVVIKLYGYIGL